MTNGNDVETAGEPSSAWSGSIVRHWPVAVVACGLLTAFHFALQHGVQVEDTRRRGLDAFTTGLAIRETVQRHSADGLFPPWDPRPGVLFYDRSEVNAIYDIGPRINWQLGDPDDAVLVTSNLIDNRVGFVLEDFPDAGKYFYLPYAVRNESEGLALLDVYRQAVSSGQPWTDDLPAPAGQGTGGTRTFYRLRRTIQEHLREAHPDLPEEHTLREQFPVLIERPHDSGGGWVTFFDRNPVWMDYPGEFPMTERFIGALTNLEAELQTSSE